MGQQGNDGSFAPPAITQFEFGTGPFTHYGAGLGWVLETPAANELRLLRTGFDGVAITFGITHPTECKGEPVDDIGDASLKQVHRFTDGIGQSLTGKFCGEGSFALVTVFTEIEQDMVQFRCWRVSGNSNACRRVY
jgi:hypothetical protein